MSQDTVNVGCFPESHYPQSVGLNISDAIAKAQKALQSLSLFGRKIDWTAAAKVVIAAALASGGNLSVIAEAVISNISTIFPPNDNPVPGDVIRDHVKQVFAMVQ